MTETSGRAEVVVKVALTVEVGPMNELPAEMNGPAAALALTSARRREVEPNSATFSIPGLAEAPAAQSVASGAWGAPTTEVK